MKMLIFLAFLFQALPSYAQYDANLELTDIYPVIMKSDKPCILYIEQACGVTTIDGKEKINYEGGSQVLDEINSYLHHMNFNRTEIVQYSRANNRICMDGKSINSVDTAYADSQNIKSDFLISWSNSNRGRCIQLKVKYDNDKSNKFVQLQYLTSSGETQNAAACGMTYEEALKKILSVAQLRCKHVPKIENSDPMYEKPISNVNSSDEPQVESNKPKKPKSKRSQPVTNINR